MPEMMKPAKTAAELNISTETLRMYAEEGRIPFVSTPGGHRRYLLEDVKHALLMEKAMKLEELKDGEQKIRLATGAPATPIKRAPRWQASPLSTIIGDAAEETKQAVLQIPFIGKPGTSRFVAGQGVHA
jgi:excisionase family DNA binding protein